MLAALLLLLACLSAVAAQDCGLGCPVTSEPVLGADGLTYMNSCFAACQGVDTSDAVAAAAAAAGLVVSGPSEEVFAAAAAAAPAGMLIPRDTLTAREQQGFRMVGVMAASEVAPSMPVLTPGMLKQMRSKRGPSRGTTMVITAQGHLYAAAPQPLAQQAAEVAAAAAAGSDNDDSSSSSSDGADAVLAAAVGGRRRLLAPSHPQPDRTSSSVSSGLLQRLGRRLQGIINKDTRKEITSAARYPFSAIGHILYTSADDGRKYQCTGSIVGTFAVLTAAHCIVGLNGAFHAGWRFTPGETSSGASAVGTADGVDFYFDSRFLGDGYLDWDIGLGVVNKAVGASSVLDYKANMEAAGRVSDLDGPGDPDASPAGAGGGASTINPGGARQPEVVMPLRCELPTPAEARAAMTKPTKLISAGYPADKAFKSLWSVSCTVRDANASNPVLDHKCPMTSGQSGSPMLQERPAPLGSKRYIVRAVVSHEMCASVCGLSCCPGQTLYNGAIKVDRAWRAWIVRNKDRVPPRPQPRLPPPSQSPSPSPSPQPSPPAGSGSPAPPEPSPPAGASSPPGADGGATSPAPDDSPRPPVPDLPPPPADDNNSLTPVKTAAATAG